MYILAIDLKPLSSPALNKLPASQFKGEEASGWFKSDIIALQRVDNVHAGLQVDFKISKQISPVFHSKKKLKKKKKFKLWNGCLDEKFLSKNMLLVVL